MFNSTVEKLQKIWKDFCQPCFDTLNCKPQLHPCHDWNFSLSGKTSKRKPTQMITTQHLDLFITNREGFEMNSGNRSPFIVVEEPSFTQSSMYSSSVFDYVNKKHHFPPLIDSNSYGSIDYDTLLNKKVS